jgi:hypothetical protein
MSWNDAKQVATDWLRGLPLPANLTGRTINLRELAEKLPYQGMFRDMVLRAAARQLRHRGARLE